MRRVPLVTVDARRKIWRKGTSVHSTLKGNEQSTSTQGRKSFAEASACIFLLAQMLHIFLRLGGALKSEAGSRRVGSSSFNISCSLKALQHFLKVMRFCRISKHKQELVTSRWHVLDKHWLSTQFLTQGSPPRVLHRHAPFRPRPYRAHASKVVAMWSLAC